MKQTIRVTKVDSIFEKDLVRNSKYYVIPDIKEIFVEYRIKKEL